MSDQAWNPGVPACRGGAFAVIYENGNSGFIWDGTKPDSFHSVIAWIQIPEKPPIALGKKVEVLPGHHVRFYSFTP